MSNSKDKHVENGNRGSTFIQETFLALPDDPDFISMPHTIPVWANIELCEQMLPVWNKNRSTDPRRMVVWKEFFTF